MLQTRFLLFAALKETYSENPDALDEAMAMVALDLHCALHTGVPVVVNGLQLRLRFCVCSVKGDWPFLIEAAHLERHFRRAPKRGESSLSSPGVCHLCLGGVSGISYTEIREISKGLVCAQVLCAVAHGWFGFHGQDVGRNTVTVVLPVGL